MNFKNLLETITKIDQPLVEGMQIAECDCDGGPQQPTQPSSVSMNVGMNATGPDGIRDLMKILRNIEQPASDLYHDAEDDVLFGDKADNAEWESEPEYAGEYDDEEEVLDDDYENSAQGSSGPTKYSVDSVLRTGNDMASKGKEARKQAGGGNPFNVSESLLGQLRNLYTEVKSR